MDKWTKYNQKLLAIITTLLVAALVLVLLGGIGVFVYSWFDDPNGGYYDQGLQVGKSSSTDSTLVRMQQISFQEPVQLDSAKALYLVPVGQVDLEEKELVRTSGSGFSSSDIEYKFGYGSKFDSYSGLFNNFILFDYPNGEKTRIFSKKVALTQWSNAKVKGTELLLFLGTDTDSNQDKLLDSEDYQSLFAYYLADKSLVEYKFENRTVLDYEPLENTPLIYLQLGIDKNKDSEFDRLAEPVELKLLNTQTRKVSDLVPSAMKAEIQSIIDK